MAAGVPTLAARNEVKGMEGHLDAEQLKSMDYKDLQALAKDMGVRAAGKAEDIIARIAAVEAGAPSMINVKTITRYLDKQLNQIKDVGEVHRVSRARAKELASAGVAEIME